MCIKGSKYNLGQGDKAVIENIDQHDSWLIGRIEVPYYLILTMVLLLPWQSSLFLLVLPHYTSNMATSFQWIPLTEQQLCPDICLRGCSLWQNDCPQTSPLLTWFHLKFYSMTTILEAGCLMYLWLNALLSFYSLHEAISNIIHLVVRIFAQLIPKLQLRQQWGLVHNDHSDTDNNAWHAEERNLTRSGWFTSSLNSHGIFQL